MYINYTTNNIMHTFDTVKHTYIGISWAAQWAKPRKDYTKD